MAPLVVGAVGVVAVATVAWTVSSLRHGTPVGVIIALSAVSVVAAFATAFVLGAPDGWDALVCFVVGASCVAVYLVVPPAAVRNAAQAIEPAVTVLAQALGHGDSGCHPPTVDVSALSEVIDVDLVCVSRGEETAVLLYDDETETGVLYSERDHVEYLGRAGCASRATDHLWTMWATEEMSCPPGNTLVFNGGA